MKIYVILHVFPGTPDPPELIGAYQDLSDCRKKLSDMYDEGDWGQEGVDFWYDEVELQGASR